MANIDVETGLPQLTEGLFWRVVDEYPYDFAFHSYISVQMIQKYQETSVIPPRYFWGLFPIEKRKIITTDKEMVVITQLLWDESNPVPEENKERRYVVSVTDDSGVEYYGVRSGCATSIQVLEAAQKAFERYERRLESNKLIGDYPPKKLE